MIMMVITRVTIKHHRCRAGLGMLKYIGLERSAVNI
jgi:hypothetical protein